MARWCVLLATLLLFKSGCAEIQYGGSGGQAAGGDNPQGGQDPQGGDGPIGGASVGGGGGDGGGGAAPSGELCLNGVDDDGDQLVDCADPECGAFECVAIPAGWQGPVALSTGPCGGDLGAEIYDLITSFTAAPAECTCECGAPQNACETFRVRGYTNQTCSNGQNNLTVSAGACANVSNAIDGKDSFQITLDNNEIGGSCQASVETTLPMVASTTQRVCGASAAPGGCQQGTCGPSTGFCIFQEGSATCPSGFTQALVAHQSLNDTRACSNGCFCGSPAGTCTATAQIFESSNCGAGTQVASSSLDMCEAFGFDLSGPHTVLITASSASVSCSASGLGLPTGAVTAVSPVTVCCAD